MVLKMLFYGIFYLFLSSSAYSQTDTSKVFTIVEKTPEYPGGLAALYKYLGKNIKYPQPLRDNGMEGNIYIKFIVEKDGSLSNIEIKYGCYGNEDCRENMTKIIKDMPRWKAGSQNGKSVRVLYAIPIRIHLE